MAFGAWFKVSAQARKVYLSRDGTSQKRSYFIEAVTRTRVATSLEIFLEELWGSVCTSHCRKERYSTDLGASSLISIVLFLSLPYAAYQFGLNKKIIRRGENCNRGADKKKSTVLYSVSS